VDGRRRVAALETLGKEPWIVDIDAVSGIESPADSATALGQSFYLANAVRHELPLIVRAAIAENLATLAKGANQHADRGCVSREAAARTVGVSADTLDRYRVAKSDPEIHDKALRGEVSLQQAARMVRSKTQAMHARSLTSSEGDIVANLERLALAGAKMDVFYADVPCDYGQASSTASAAPQKHYPTMSTDELKALPVGRIAAKDALLWYWTPNSVLADALEVIKAWGFTYVTSAVWIKPTGVPTRCAVRPHHETLLLAKRGQGLIYVGEQMPSFYQSPALSRAHSAKPQWFAKQLDRLFPNTAKLELFARSTRPGWVTLGNQLPLLGQVAGAGTVATNDDAASASIGDGNLAATDGALAVAETAASERGAAEGFASEDRAVVAPGGGDSLAPDDLAASDGEGKARKTAVDEKTVQPKQQKKTSRRTKPAALAAPSA
jgi:N6-adenosine-specific RNA methylase IME4